MSKTRRTSRAQPERTAKSPSLCDADAQPLCIDERDVTDVYINTPYIESIRNDTSRSLMGGRQEAWLYNNLEKSKATWKVVAQRESLPRTSPTAGAISDERRLQRSS